MSQFFVSRFSRGLLAFIAFLGVTTVAPAHAGLWEFQAGMNYNRSTYAGGSYSWTRRFGGSIGYNFSDASTIELAYQRSRERTHYAGFVDSTYDDQVTSLNLVWNLLDRNSILQPYVKTGIGQLNRRSSTVNVANQSEKQSIDQMTGVIGAGLKLYLTKQFAVRLEATSYLSGAKLGTWKDNFGATLGVSVYF